MLRCIDKGMHRHSRIGYNGARVIEPNVTTSGPADDEERGIALCRAGEWDRGVDILARQINSGERLSSTGYSYLGYGMALRRRQIREGLKLCEQAVKLEFYQPDNFLNLARTQVLAGNRRAAAASMRRGLALDRGHRGLRALAKDLGIRRAPVLRFLGRGNPLNVLLGRLRHAIKD